MMESKKKHSVDEEILNTFWGLAETDEEKRIAALETLVNLLLLKQSNNKHEPSAEVDYTVKRLIKGLASDRGCARLGFAAALEQVLKKFQFYTIPQLMELVETKLKYQRSDAKAEISQVLIGRMTALDSIIRAFPVKEIDKDQLVKFIRTVLAVGTKKSFLGQITLEILYEIMSKFDKNEFKDELWPLVEKEMCQGWLLEAMSSGDQKSGIRDGSELLLAWAAMDVISGNDRTSEEKQHHNMEARRKWAVSTLVSLVAQASNDPKWLLHLMKFFVLAAFFEIQKPNPQITHCEKLFAVQVSPEFRQLLQNGLVKALGKLTDTCSGKVSSVKTFIEFLFNLSLYIQSLLSSIDNSVASDLLTQEDRRRWNMILKTVRKLHSQSEKEQSNRVEAFELLFLHQGLLLFLDRSDSRENLDEIHSCHKCAFEKQNKLEKKKVSADEPLWIDVLVDVLMHLLLQESHLTRNIVKMTSSLLNSEYTLTSIQLITQVLEAQKGADIGFENNEGGSADDNMASDEEVEEEEDIGDGDDEEEDEEDAEDKDAEDGEGQIDFNFKDRIKAALGGAVVPSDAEDSLSDLDDDAMMKIDEMSAQILRQRAEVAEKKKQLKEQEVQLRHYKLRCLDLVEDVARHTESAAMLLELIMPLLKLMKIGQHRAEFQEVGGRARKILHEIFQRHKLKDDKNMSAEELQRVVIEIQMTMKDTGSGMSKEVANACLFVVRLTLGLEQNAAEAKTEDGCKTSSDKKSFVNALILDFFKRKDSKMQPSFIRLLAERFSNIVWSLKDELLSFVLDSDVRVFSRTQACVVLAALLTQKKVKELDQEGEFTLKLRKAVLKLIMDTEVSELKPKFAEELVLLFIQASSGVTAQVKEEIPENFIEKISLLRKINKDVRKQCNRLTGLLQKNSSKKKDKKKKKKTDDSANMECDDVLHVTKEPWLEKGSKSKKHKKLKSETPSVTNRKTETAEAGLSELSIGKQRKRKRSETE